MQVRYWEYFAEKLEKKYKKRIATNQLNASDQMYPK